MSTRDIASMVTLIVLLVIIFILVAMLDASSRLAEKREHECLPKQDTNSWELKDLYNPSGAWCFLDQEKPLPVDCQFNSEFWILPINSYGY